MAPDMPPKAARASVQAEARPVASTNETKEQRSFPRLVGLEVSAKIDWNQNRIRI